MSYARGPKRSRPYEAFDQPRLDPTTGLVQGLGGAGFGSGFLRPMTDSPAYACPSGTVFLVLNKCSLNKLWKMACTQPKQAAGSKRVSHTHTGHRYAQPR